MAEKLLKSLIPLTLFLSLSGCGTGKGPGLAAGFADTLTIAYIPKGMSTFPDFEAYRQFPDVVQELGFIDLAVRDGDIGTLEVGPAGFAQLKALAEAPTLDAAALSRLPVSTGKLLLVMGGDYSTFKTPGTRILDATMNTARVVAMLAGDPVAFSAGKHETKLHRHAFRAILFDAKAGTVFDTTMVGTEDGLRGKSDRPSEEPLATRHYCLYVRQAKQRGSPGPRLP